MNYRNSSADQRRLLKVNQVAKTIIARRKRRLNDAIKGIVRGDAEKM